MINENYLIKSEIIISKQIPKKSIHFGFSIFRNFLALNVIITHCFKDKYTKNRFILFITKARNIHVPCFFIMSFYFNHNAFISIDAKKKINRFERLLIPYLGWPIIIFIFSYIFNFFKKSSYIYSFQILIYQLIFGEGVGLFHFWFLLDLIFTTFLFHLIIYFFRNTHLFVLNLVLICSYFVQYSNLGSIIIINTFKHNALSREHDMIPYAVTGFTLSSLKILKILANYQIYTTIFCVLIYNLVENYRVFNRVLTVAYGGIKLNVISICIIIIISFFPLSIIKNKYLIIILKYMTNYSAGIFYLHQAVKFYSCYYINSIKKGTFSGVIMIYLISYFISFSGANLFRNIKAKNLFC